MSTTEKRYAMINDRYGPDPFECTEAEFVAMVSDLARDNPEDWAVPTLREFPDGSLRERVGRGWDMVLVPIRREIFAANPHDRGFDLLPGRNINNPQVGSIYFADGGLTIRLHQLADGTINSEGVESFCPDTVDEAISFLRDCGYDLDADSVPLIEALSEDQP